MDLRDEVSFSSSQIVNDRLRFKPYIKLDRILSGRHTVPVY